MKGWTASRALKSEEGMDMGKEATKGANMDGVDVCRELKPDGLELALPAAGSYQHCQRRRGLRTQGSRIHPLPGGEHAPTPSPTGQRRLYRRRSRPARPGRP